MAILYNYGSGLMSFHIELHSGVMHVVYRALKSNCFLGHIDGLPSDQCSIWCWCQENLEESPVNDMDDVWLRLNWIDGFHNVSLILSLSVCGPGAKIRPGQREMAVDNHDPYMPSHTWAFHSCRIRLSRPQNMLYCNRVVLTERERERSDVMTGPWSLVPVGTGPGQI